VSFAFFCNFLFVFIQVSDEDFLMKKFMNSTLLGLRAASYQKWHKIKCSFNSVVEGGGYFLFKDEFQNLI
jgi:hypothetical protein